LPKNRRHIQAVKDSLPLNLPSGLERAITGPNRAGAFLGAEDDNKEQMSVSGRPLDLLYRAVHYRGETTGHKVLGGSQ